MNYLSKKKNKNKNMEKQMRRRETIKTEKWNIRFEKRRHRVLVKEWERERD